MEETSVVSPIVPISITFSRRIEELCAWGVPNAGFEPTARLLVVAASLYWLYNTLPKELLFGRAYAATELRCRVIVFNWG
jgi:hypothetical protein